MTTGNAIKPSFSSEQVQQNQSARRKLHDLLPLLDEAEACGVNVDGYRALAAGLQAQLEAIHAKFMSTIKQEI